LGYRSHPQKFQARTPEAVFENLKEKKVIEIEKAKAKVLNALAPARKVPPTRVILATGQKEVFSIAVQMYKRTKKEILLISIGEPIPEELLLAIRDTLKRGVNENDRPQI